jgi:hypothetical protein
MTRARSVEPLLLIAMAFACGCGNSATTPSTTTTTTQVRVTAPFGMFTGESDQARAMASSNDVSTVATWRSSNTAVATVSTTGLVTTIAPGTTQLTATYQGASGSDTLVVSRDSDLMSVVLQTCVGPIAIGQTMDCGAIANIDGVIGTPNITSKANWSSSNAAVLFVGPGGHLIGIAPGVATTSASYRGKTGVVAISVIGPPQNQQDELRVTGGAASGPFRVGSIVSISQNVTYTLVSAASAQLTMNVSNQNGVAVTNPGTFTVNKGSGAAGLTAAFTVPQGTTRVCALVILQAGSKVVVDMATAPLCVSIDP